MKSKIAAVEMFHKSFGLGVENRPKANLGIDKIKLRFNLMDEENKEYFDAALNDDMVEVADALGDMLYILCGTILEHGMQYKIEEVFDPPLYDKSKERVPKSHYFVKDFKPVSLGAIRLEKGRTTLKLDALDLKGKRIVDVHSVDLIRR